jgi:hypothetical protein
MKTLAEIKKELGVETINMDRVVTEQDEQTSWLKDWDNNNRVAILMHEDTYQAILADPAISTLGVHYQTKKGANGNYEAKTIVMYKKAEFVL